MRSEGSDAYVEEDTSSVLEDNSMASDKVTSAPGKKGKKRTSSRSKKDNLSDLESRMIARIEQQDKQVNSMNDKMGKLLDLLQDKRTDTGNEVPRSEHEYQNTVTVEAFSAARRPLIPLNSAINEHQNSGDDIDTLSVRISDSERQNSGFLFSAEGSENSRNSDHEDVNTCDSRSVLVKSGEHDRFQKYLGNRNEKSCETEKQDNSVSHTLGDKFGLDAYTSLKTEKTGLVLEQNQIDVLRGSWRSETPHKITSYKENYRLSFPIDTSCQEYFNVPTMDNTVESLLMKRYGPKAAFGRVPSLFTKNLKSLERLAYQGQVAARMGLITTCYLQQASGNLLDNLTSDSPNLDSAIQNVRDIFALSTKSLDQTARTGAFHHMIRRRATMYDTGLNELRDYANTIVTLPLTADGIFGSQFDTKMKEKTDRNKQLAEVLPDNRRVTLGSQLGKRKPTATVTSESTFVKKPKFDSNFKIPKKNFGEFKSSGKQTQATKPWNKAIPMDDPYSEYDSETENDVAYKTLPHGKTYHAFISYRDVDEDREWVSDLIEKLKKLHQLKCCNHVYHFKPGRKIVDNIKYAVRKSVKTLIILSKEYNDSHWCTFEVEYTHHMSMEMREQLIIPVLKEDCEIPDHLKPFTYIDARGPIGSWLPRLATSIESPVLCGLESKYSQVDFSTHYRNFDTVHEERSKIGWCRELPFKSRRYIPDSLNDKAFNINNTLYKGVLRAISRSSFFVCRQCVFPWFPIICCWFILVGLGISMFAYFCRSYVFLTHIRSDGKVMAELKLKVQKQNVTEEKWIHDHVSHSIEMMAKSWFYIILVVAWLTCCLVFFLKKRKLMYNALMISNQRLIDHNLLVGFKHYKCLATIKVIFIYFNSRPCLDYLEQCIKKLHVDPSQSDDECCTQHESPPCSQVNDSTDDAIIPLLGNEVMANHIEKSDREKAGDILIRISVDFVLDFLEQKLENSESYRHTSRAVCMCEYAETHGFLPVPVNESGNSERGFRNRSGGATNDFSNVV